MAPERAARFARQILLAELGVSGQERICAARAAVGGADTLEHEVATRYAERAGFAAVVPGAIDVDALAPTTVVAVPAARAVLAGARAALAAMRAHSVSTGSVEPTPAVSAGSVEPTPAGGARTTGSS